MDSKTKNVILLLNLGGPEKPTDVKPFLYRLFVDPEIIRIPFTPLRQLVAWLIATTRSKKSIALYQKIGGGSPIRRLTEQQAHALRSSLMKKGYDVDTHVAFTCSAPVIESVVQKAAQSGATTFIALPLYPQYSYTTTKSALDRTRAAVATYASHARLLEVRGWPTQPSFIAAHADLIQQTLNNIPPDDRKDAHLVFSAHSIPEKLVTQLGDPYKKQMEETVAAVLQKLHWNGAWTLSWQSKLGPIKWLTPSTEDVVVNLGRKKTKDVVVIPIAFVTDHIETLQELDMELAEEARHAGVVNFRRVPGLNDHPLFIQALVELSVAELTR